jgi:hypothetical protein
MVGQMLRMNKTRKRQKVGIHYLRVEGVDDQTHQLRDLSLEGKSFGV